ncbi:MAG: PAS domain S-box protein [Candidatus Latescibacterota bacterium]
MAQEDTRAARTQGDDRARLLGEVQALRAQVARLRAQNEQTESRFRSLVDAVPDIIYQLDADGRILFISDAVKRYGYDPEKLKGAHILDLIHPTDRSRAVYRVNERRTRARRTRALQVRLLSGQQRAVSFEFVGSGHPPQARTLEINAEGLYGVDPAGAGTFLGTQGVARDITDRLRAEAAQRQSERVRVLSETAGAAAHEINQPLTVVVGTVEMLMARLPAGDPLQAELQEVLAAGRRIAEIVLQMRSAHRYVTKPYMEGSRIADFEAASDTPRPPEGEDR